MPELREPTALWEPPIKTLLPSHPSTDSGPAAPAPPAGPSPPFRGGKCEEACTPRTPASLASPHHPGPAAIHTLKPAPVCHQEAVTEPSLAPRRMGPPTESRTDPGGTGLSEHVSLPKSWWAFSSARTVCPSRCHRTGQTWLESGPREDHPLHLSLPRVVLKHGRVKHSCLTDHACPPHGLTEPEVSELWPKAPSCGRQVRTSLRGPVRADGGRLERALWSPAAGGPSRTIYTACRSRRNRLTGRRLAECY